ncbi:MAG: hypothetical protein ACI9QN_001238 [Arcticibacterium sp.]
MLHKEDALAGEKYQLFELQKYKLKFFPIVINFGLKVKKKITPHEKKIFLCGSSNHHGFV